MRYLGVFLIILACGAMPAVDSWAGNCAGWAVGLSAKIAWLKEVALEASILHGEPAKKHSVRPTEDADAEWIDSIERILDAAIDQRIAEEGQRRRDSESDLPWQFEVNGVTYSVGALLERPIPRELRRGGTLSKTELDPEVENGAAAGYDWYLEGDGSMFDFTPASLHPGKHIYITADKKYVITQFEATAEVLFWRMLTLNRMYEEAGIPTPKILGYDVEKRLVVRHYYSAAPANDTFFAGRNRVFEPEGVDVEGGAKPEAPMGVVESGFSFSGQFVAELLSTRNNFTLEYFPKHNQFLPNLTHQFMPPEIPQPMRNLLWSELQKENSAFHRQREDGMMWIFMPDGRLQLAVVDP